MFREYLGDVFRPQPGEVGPAVGQPWRRRLQIRLAVRSTWNPGRRVPEPLSCELPAQDDREDGDETCFHGLLPERIVP